MAFSCVLMSTQISCGKLHEIVASSERIENKQKSDKIFILSSETFLRFPPPPPSHSLSDSAQLGARIIVYSTARLSCLVPAQIEHEEKIFHFSNAHVACTLETTLEHGREMQRMHFTVKKISFFSFFVLCKAFCLDFTFSSDTFECFRWFSHEAPPRER